MATADHAPGDEPRRPPTPPDPERIAAEDDYQARMQAFLEESERLRALTAGRRHTPAEVLIREDRDRRDGRLWPLD